jgi:hypothetical protein
MPLCLYSPNGVSSMGSDKGRIEEDFGPVLLGGCEGVFEGIAGVSSEVGQHFQEDNTEGGLEDCRVATRRRNGDVGNTLGRRLVVPLWLLSRRPFPCIPSRQFWAVLS